jgi:hypothetical protein
MTISTDTESSVEEFGYRQELKRSLSLLDLLVYGIVFIIPIAPIPVFGIVYNASHGMVPLIYLGGLVIVVYVFVNAQIDAKIAGTAWMIAGLALFVGLKLAGRPTALPVEESRAEI